MWPRSDPPLGLAGIWQSGLRRLPVIRVTTRESDFFVVKGRCSACRRRRALHVRRDPRSRVEFGAGGGTSLYFYVAAGVRTHVHALGVVTVPHQRPVSERWSHPAPSGVRYVNCYSPEDRFRSLAQSSPSNALRV